MKVLVPLFAAFLVGCARYRQDIQICPENCKPVVEYDDKGSYGSASDAWMAYDERLKKENIFYWLTDSEGQPVTTYDYKHDRGMFESAYWPNLPTKEKPKPVREPFKLKGSTQNVILHLKRPDSEETILLRDAKLEHHKDLDILYVK